MARQFSVYTEGSDDPSGTWDGGAGATVACNDPADLTILHGFIRLIVCRIAGCAQAHLLRSNEVLSHPRETHQPTGQQIGGLS